MYDPIPLPKHPNSGFAAAWTATYGNGQKELAHTWRKAFTLTLQLGTEAARNCMPLQNASASQKSPAGLNAFILRSLEDSKAEDIVSIDIAGKSTIGDYMVVASGRSHRHVGAVSDHLLRNLKTSGFGSCRVEGLKGCDWVLIDAGDVIVHVFRPEVRGFYNIEKMWSAIQPEQSQI